MITDKNPFLFNLFKIKYCLAYLALAGIAALLFLARSQQLSDPFEGFLMVAIPLVIPFAKFELCWLLSAGHGVSVSPKPTVLRMRIWVFVMILSLYSIITMIWWLSVNFSKGYPGDQLRVTVFCTTFLFSLTLSVLRWHFTMYFNAYAAGEYETRLLFKHSNVPPEQAEAIIRHGRAEGLIGNEYE